MKDHRSIDERSLAFHRLIAQKIARDPALLKKAESNIARWLPTTSERAQGALKEWQRLLAAPLQDLLEFMISEDEDAKRLRQSSPFPGILTQEERMQIIREFRARESAAA